MHANQHFTDIEYVILAKLQPFQKFENISSGQNERTSVKRREDVFGERSFKLARDRALHDQR